MLPSRFNQPNISSDRCCDIDVFANEVAGMLGRSWWIFDGVGLKWGYRRFLKSDIISGGGAGEYTFGVVGVATAAAEVAEWGLVTLDSADCSISDSPPNALVKEYVLLLLLLLLLEEEPVAESSSLAGALV